MRILAKGILLICLATGFAANAQDGDASELNLGDLMNMPTDLATGREVARREAPGVITIITRQEIEDSGVRDLLEAITLFVPGAGVALDVESITGIGIRGITAQEGKVLMLVDGIPMNEEVWSTVQLGHHYPAEMIERIEVIRGPGSVIYGGYAQVGVISVTTRHSTQSGSSLALRGSRMSKVYSHQAMTGAVGGREGALQYSFLGSVGSGNQTERDYTDGNGDVLNLANEHTRKTIFFDGGLEYKGLQVRGIFDRLSLKNQDWDAVMLPGHESVHEDYDNRGLKASYVFKANDSLKITPVYLYRYTRPFHQFIETQKYYHTFFSERHQAGLNVDAKLSDSVALLSGFSYARLKLATEGDDDEFQIYRGGRLDESMSVFSELSWQTPSVNWTLGGRYEDPTNFSPAFVPRLVAAKAFSRWHYKAMYSQAYRMPSGIQEDLTGDPNVHLKPEVATNYEFETGYLFTSDFFAVLTLFDTRVNNPIVWKPVPLSLDPQGDYLNEGHLGSQGAEAEFRYKIKNLEIVENTAYYQRANSSDKIYNVPGHDDYYLAFPKWRANLIATYRFTPRFALVPSLAYYGTRYGFVSDSSGQAGLLKRYDANTILNLNLMCRDIFLKGLQFSAGVSNLTNANLDYIQSYHGSYNYPPVPGLSRAYNFMLAYSRDY